MPVAIIVDYKRMELRKGEYLVFIIVTVCDQFELSVGKIVEMAGDDKMFITDARIWYFNDTVIGLVIFSLLV